MAGRVISIESVLKARAKTEAENTRIEEIYIEMTGGTKEELSRQRIEASRNFIGHVNENGELD